MGERDKQLPPYFKEYLEQKFNELHNAIKTNKEDHDKDVFEIKETYNKEIKEIKSEQKWQRDMIKVAVGGLGVLTSVMTIVGFVFLTYFKTLNKQQIQEAIKEQQTDIANEVVTILEDKYEPKIQK